MANAPGAIGEPNRGAQNLREGFVVSKIPNPVLNVAPKLRRFLVYPAALAAAAMLMLAAAPAQRAEALSLINPGASPLAAKYASEVLIAQVRGGHGRGGHGGGHGGGGFHGGGGGFHGGGFHGGGFRGFSGGFRGGFVGRPHAF